MRSKNAGVSDEDEPILEADVRNTFARVDAGYRAGKESREAKNGLSERDLLSVEHGPLRGEYLLLFDGGGSDVTILTWLKDSSLSPTRAIRLNNEQQNTAATGV